MPYILLLRKFKERKTFPGSAFSISISAFKGIDLNFPKKNILNAVHWTSAVQPIYAFSE